MISEQRRVPAFAIVLVLAGLAAYANTFNAPFLLDDLTYITENAALPKLWPPWEIYPSRPVLGASLALSYRLSGLDPWGYHVFNLVVHLLAGLTLFGLVRRTLLTEAMAPRWGRWATGLALVIALIWLVHPLQTQAVTYVIQRSESLMGLFYLLTLYCAVRAHDSTWSGAWWLAALVASALGLGCKQVMATAPVVVFLYYWVFFPDVFRRRGVRVKLWWAALLAPWIAAAGYLAVISAHPTAGFGAPGISPWSYACTQSEVLLHYLRLAAWPTGLCLDYGWPMAATAAQVWPALSAVVILLALTAWGVVKRHPAAFAAAWFFVILAPTSSFIPLGDPAAEHRMYLPLAGLLALALPGAWAAWQWAASRIGPLGAASEGPAWQAAAILALLLGGLTAMRNREYRDEVSLWQDTASKRPENARAQSNLAVLLTRTGRAAEAVPHAREAVRLKPRYAEARNNLGYALNELGRPQEAIPEFQEALRLDPKYALALANLGIALGRLGRYAEAERQLRQSVNLTWHHPEAHCNLGVAIHLSGRPRDALKHYQEALRQRPGYAKAHSYLGAALADLGRDQEALPHFEAALRIAPDAATHHNMALALARLGRDEQALRQYEAALKLEPGSPRTHKDCADLLARLGRSDEARAQYAEALKLKPDYAEAHLGLAVEALKARDRAAARAHLTEALRLKPDLAEARELLRRLEQP